VRQDQSGRFTIVRAYCAEDIRRCGALVVRRRWPAAAPCQRRVILFFWPILASSSNQISMSLGCTPWSRAISSRRARKFYGMARLSTRQRKLPGQPEEGRLPVNIVVLGIDLGKNSCSVVGLDAGGRVVLRRRLHREGVVKLAAGLTSCVMAMEACCAAYHLGRMLREQGHQVGLMSPEYVRPYVKAQKDDDRDAEAIAEAATRPTMRFAELKSEEQLDMQSLHRARGRLVG
jgi:hypothetical protein